MLDFHLGYIVTVVITELVPRGSVTFNLESAKGFGSVELSVSKRLAVHL